MSNKEKILLTFNINEISLEYIYVLEDELEVALKQGKAGEVDGHEISDDYTGKIFLYGSDKKGLLQAIKSVLEKDEFSKIKVII